jgi:hypothetical protein
MFGLVSTGNAFQGRDDLKHGPGRDQKRGEESARSRSRPNAKAPARTALAGRRGGKPWPLRSPPLMLLVGSPSFLFNLPTPADSGITAPDDAARTSRGPAVPSQTAAWTLVPVRA